MQRRTKVGLAIAMMLAFTSGAGVAEAKEMQGEMCGVITVKQDFGGWVTISRWGVWAKGLDCNRAVKVAKRVAKSPNYQIQGWKCVSTSGWVDLRRERSDVGVKTRIACKNSRQFVQLGWGA